MTTAGPGLYAEPRFREKEARKHYPDAPWMWRRDWARGRIGCSGGGAVVSAWVRAGLWNAFSAPLLWTVPEEVFRRGNPGALIGLLFPLIGVVLIVWAIRSTLRWQRYGASTFEMESIPAVIGDKLSGSIHLGTNLRPEGGFELKLTCVRRVTRRLGASRRTRERTLWEEKQEVPMGHLQVGPTGTGIPVSLSIPANLEPTSPERSNNEIVWRLEAQADGAGVDYRARFEVPVFRTSR